MQYRISLLYVDINISCYNMSFVAFGHRSRALFKSSVLVLPRLLQPSFLFSDANGNGTPPRTGSERKAELASVAESVARGDPPSPRSAAAPAPAEQLRMRRPDGDEAAASPYRLHHTHALPLDTDCSGVSSQMTGASRFSAPVPRPAVTPKRGVTTFPSE